MWTDCVLLVGRHTVTQRPLPLRCCNPCFQRAVGSVKWGSCYRWLLLLWCLICSASWKHVVETRKGQTRGRVVHHNHSGLQSWYQEPMVLCAAPVQPLVWRSYNDRLLMKVTGCLSWEENKERKGSSAANMSKAVVVNSGKLFAIIGEQIGLLY